VQRCARSAPCRSAREPFSRLGPHCGVARYADRDAAELRRTSTRTAFDLFGLAQRFEAA
jgi:hypothetical protein